MACEPSVTAQDTAGHPDSELAAGQEQMPRTEAAAEAGVGAAGGGEVPIKVQVRRGARVTQSRRVSLVRPTFAAVRGAVRQWGAAGAWQLQYTDGDGDEVTVRSEEEWDECLRLWAGAQGGAAPPAPLRLVCVLPAPQRDASPPPPPPCATAGCAFLAHRDPAPWNGAGRYCCAACMLAAGGRHGRRCERHDSGDAPDTAAPPTEEAPVCGGKGKGKGGSDGKGKGCGWKGRGKGCGWKGKGKGGVAPWDAMSAALDQLHGPEALQRIIAGGADAAQQAAADYLTVRSAVGGWVADLSVDVPRLARRLHADGVAALEAGALAAAERCFELQGRLCPANPCAAYNLACARALRGDADGAFAALDAALQRGYAGAAHMARDPDLAALRGDPRWAAAAAAAAATSADAPAPRRSTGAGAPLRCGGGHTLRGCRAPHWRFSCDECGAAQPVGAALLSCRACDYDVCAACAEARASFAAKADEALRRDEERLRQAAEQVDKEVDEQPAAKPLPPGRVHQMLQREQQHRELSEKRAHQMLQREQQHRELLGQSHEQLLSKLTSQVKFHQAKAGAARQLKEAKIEAQAEFKDAKKAVKALSQQAKMEVQGSGTGEAGKGQDAEQDAERIVLKVHAAAEAGSEAEVLASPTGAARDAHAEVQAEVGGWVRVSPPTPAVEEEAGGQPAAAEAPRFAAELAALRAMGLCDDARSVRVLDQLGGDVQRAIPVLLDIA